MERETEGERGGQSGRDFNADYACNSNALGTGTRLACRPTSTSTPTTTSTSTPITPWQSGRVHRPEATACLILYPLGVQNVGSCFVGGFLPPNVPKCPQLVFFTNFMVRCKRRSVWPEQQGWVFGIFPVRVVRKDYRNCRWQESTANVNAWGRAPAGASEATLVIRSNDDVC